MKKISLFLLIALSLIIGCSKDAIDSDALKIDKKANQKETGDAANEFLSDSKFKNLTIEIGYVTGFKPTETAVANFTSFLRERIRKNNINVLYKELASPNKDSLSIEEVFDLEKENRTIYNDGDTLALYIYFSDTSSDGDDAEKDLVTLGAVYRNTSMVIYESTIRKLAIKSYLINNATVETATLNHEAGHLFGLVNLGSPSVNVHEDSEAENHCNEQNCLMRAELQFGTGMSKMLTAKNGLIPNFGPECIKDLQANGGK